MRIAPLVPAMATVLLFCGCDYWRNLTESKSVTKVDLAIAVNDAWDSRPLVGAVCGESARNLSFSMGGLGTAHLPEAATGNYSLACRAEGYHERILDFEVGGKGAVVTVLLARRGFMDWYPEEPEKRPRILIPIDTIRYPSKFDLPAFPRDSSGIFRFEWTFAKNPRLNRASGSIFASLPYYRMDVDPSEVTEGPDMLTLKVRSRLAGVGNDTGYVVGIDSLPIVWIRNKLPRFSTFRIRDHSFKLGCGVDTVFMLTFEAEDPDGSCDSVVFHTKDTSQALGRVHETRSCTDPNPLLLPIRNPFHRPTDFPLTLENTLSISVWDGNREHFDTSIQFTTFNNVLPTITAGTTESQTEFFTNSKVFVWLEAKASDGTVERLEIDWGDGDGDGPKNIPLKISQAGSLRDTIQHVYKKQGNYAITAFVMDACNDTGSTKLREVRVRNNTAPSIQIQPQPSLPSDSAYSIRLTILDKDVEEGTDRYKRILIDWKDGQRHLDSTVVGDRYPYTDTLLSHYYAGPPPNGMSYKVIVEVTDGQDGTAIDSILIPAQARP